MVYESTISYVTTNDNGDVTTKKERYVIDCVNTFTEVESIMTKEFGDFQSFDVTSIKRSKIKEVANQRSCDEDKVFLADVCDVFTDDNGVEREMVYTIAFYSRKVASAVEFISEYIKQGYDMSLISVRQTKFVDIIV